ncbi:MAG: ABC transporter substrate-binding protein [Acidimicrobiales bacterium]
MTCRAAIVLARTGLLAFALFAAGCAGGAAPAPSDDGAPRVVDDSGDPATSPATTGDATDSDNTDGSTPGAELTASFRGVTPEVIRVGITTVDWDTLAAAGVDFGRTNDLDLWQAALEDINSRGGIHGRQIEVHGREFLPLGSEQFDQACVELTEDEEVFVAIGQALEDQVLCFTEANDTAAVMVSGMTESLLTRSTAPYATLWASFETQAANMVALAEEEGVLDGATIGVVGSADVGVLEYQSIVDAFGDAGYDVVEGLIGANDTDLAETARDQAIVFERMREAGVDLTVSTTGVPLEIFNAQSEGYESEQWLLNVAMTPSALADAGVDLAYLDGALAIVNTPVGTTQQEAMADDPAVSACVDMLEAGSDHELSYALDAEANDLASALYACAITSILETALTAAGPDLTNDSFAAALGAIGPIDLAGYFGASLESDDLGAAKTLRMASFDSAAGGWELLD